LSKETYKRDLYTLKETYIRDEYASKETCTKELPMITTMVIKRDIQKRPTKETYKRDLQKRPTKETSQKTYR